MNVSIARKIGDIQDGLVKWYGLKVRVGTMHVIRRNRKQTV